MRNFLFSILVLAASSVVFAKTCEDTVTVLPVSNWIHFDKSQNKFLNIACAAEQFCVTSLLSELRKIEPAFKVPDERTHLIIEEAIYLAHKWKSALALSWQKDQEGRWTLRLSLDIPPAGESVVQSGSEVKSPSSLPRIDITIEPTRTTVMFARVAATKSGNSYLTAEWGSHGGGVVLQPEANPPAIDALGLRREFFVGPQASQPLLRALEAATAVTFALRPGIKTISLEGRHGLLAENRAGVWVWSSGN